MPVADVEKAAVEGGLTQDQAQAVAADYGDAQLEALRLALGAVAAAALLSLWFTRRLPTESLAEERGQRHGAGGCDDVAHCGEGTSFYRRRRRPRVTFAAGSE